MFSTNGLLLFSEVLVVLATIVDDPGLVFFFAGELESADFSSIKTN